MTTAGNCITSTTRNGYLSLRRVYEPQTLKLIIVAESPPISGRYFYNPDGAITEPLFAALIMKQLNLSPGTKEAGLRAFQGRGWLLVDATYEPVNKLTDAGRNNVIHRDYPSLRHDLRQLTGKQAIPLVLLKANVCRTLQPKLIADGFNVINQREVVYFPSNGRQNEFHKQFADLLNVAGL
jgi:hypothetical protein